SVRLRIRPQYALWAAVSDPRNGPARQENTRTMLRRRARRESGSAVRPQINWLLTWPEDRATRRLDPSAVPGAKTGDGMPRGVPFLSVSLRDWRNAINLSGSGWQSPPAATADVPEEVVVMRGVWS